MKIVTRKDGISIVDFTNTVSIKEANVQSARSVGHDIVKVIMQDGSEQFFMSKQKDDYIRNMRTVDEWSKDIVLFASENDHSLWQSNVIDWFDGAMQNEEYKYMIASIYKDVKPSTILNEAMSYMMRQKPKKSNTRGKRRGDLHQWLLCDKIPFAEKVARKIKREKEDK